MGTPLGPMYIPYAYMDPLGIRLSTVGIGIPPALDDLQEVTRFTWVKGPCRWYGIYLGPKGVLIYLL